MDKVDEVMEKIYNIINVFNRIRKPLYKNQYKNIVAVRYEWFEPMEYETGSSLVCKEKYRNKRYLKKIIAQSKTRIITDKEFKKGTSKIRKYKPLSWDRILYDNEDDTDIGEAKYTFIFKNGMQYKITSYLSENKEGEKQICDFVQKDN